MDINDPEVIAAVRDLPGQDVVYSGPGGAILGHDLLACGKRFLHAHPGTVPMYRGSTTIYYSMLVEKKIGVSVFVMNENIDGGDLLLQREFPVVPGADYDYVVDPCVRAVTLLETLQTQPVPHPQPSGGTNYYVIHPVLKHLAVLSLGDSDRV